MLVRSFGLCATFALAANSVMIPPDVSLDGLSDDNSMETLGVDAFKHTYKLDCPGCPFAASQDGKVAWKQDIENSLVIDFNIGQNLETLEIGGVQLYPPEFSHFNNPFYITQEDKESGSSTQRLRITGYAFHYNTAETISEAGTELLPMTFRVTSLEGKNISPPSLTIYILKDISGSIMIASIQPTPASPENESPKKPSKECKDWPLLCKWKSIIADKLKGIKNSLEKGKGGCHKGNPMRPGGHGKRPHMFRPGRPDHRPHHTEGEEDGRPHRHHGHHHGHHHRFRHFVRRFLFTIFFPIIIGIIAGAFTYLLGMALGCGIAFIWMKIRGVQRPAYEQVAQDEEDGGDDEDAGSKDSDKEVYCEPPAYEGEAPPVYEEAAEKEVVNEIHEAQ